MKNKMKLLFNRILHGLPLVLTAILLSVIMYSLVEPGNPLAALGAEVFFAPDAVTITATKTDTLFNDVDGDFNADPGDTLQYTIVVANSGDTDALNTTLTDLTDDTELTVVAGSLRATPIGRNDTYSVIGNTHITHPVGTGVLANDLDPDGGTFTASCAPCTTANGGTVTLNPDGSFTYSPPAGFTGADTFTYTVTDNHGLTDTGTVTFNVTNRIWWVDSNAAGAGTGTSLNPFQALSSAQTASGVNDVVFIYNRGATYTGGFAMNNGERQCGHGADLQTCSGLTPPTGTTFPAVSTNPTLTNGAGHVLTLGQNNTIHGVTLGNAGSAANFALFGSNFGTVNIQTVTITTNHGGLSLATGTATATFTSVTSAGGTNNVALSSVNGNLNLGGGALTGASGNAVNIVGGTAAFSTTATITNTSANAVNIQNKTGGTVTFGGAINSVSGGTGITLLNNTGASITFAGSMTLNTGATTAFSASGGGTLTVLTGINTATTTIGTGIDIQDMTIGVSGVTFRSVTTNGAPNGIYLQDNTGTGAFTITGTGVVASGGTIQNGSGANGSTDGIGIYMNNNTHSVSLNWMQLNGFSNFAIRGITVSNVNISNSVVSGTNGNDAASDEGSISFDNLTGTATVTNLTVSGGHEDNFRVVNSSGVLNFTMTGSTVRDNTNVSPGNNGLWLQADSTANITANITTSSFLRNRANGIQAITNGSGIMDITIGTNGVAGSGGIFQDNNIGVNIAHNSSGTLNFDVQNGTFQPVALTTGASPININLGSLGNQMSGNIRNNVITNNNSPTGPGMRIIGNGAGTMTILVNGNTVSQIGNRGIEIIARDGSNTINATITNNTVTLTDPLSADGIRADAGAVSTDTTTICANFSNNTSTTIVGLNGIRVRQRFAGTTYRLQGYGGSATDMTAVQNFLSSNNNGAITLADFAGTGFQNGSCPTPTEAPALIETNEQLETAESTSFDTPTSSVNEPTAQETAVTPLPVIELVNTGDSDNQRVNEETAETNTLAPEATTTVGPFTLPPGESTTITFQAVIQNPFPAAQNPICNQAAISGSNFSNVLSDDPAVAGSSDPTCTTVQINADLSITKTDGATTEIPGTSVTYTIVASNAGPNPDPAAIVADTFPATITGVTWTCVGAGGATCTASGSGNINQTVNLPVGGSVTFTAIGTINPAATGTLANTATAATSTGITDPVPANNSATDTDTLTPQVDVSITKTDGQTEDIPGTSITYTIGASNSGPSNAPSVTVADTFPAALTGVTWTCVGAGGGTCTASGSGNISDTANLPAGGSVTYTVNATIAASATGTLSNTATTTVGGGVTDTNAANNNATDTTTLTPQVDLSITKTDGSPTEVPGTSVTYTIVASNAGPSDDPSATIADTFPAILSGVTWTCVGAGGGTCAASGSGNINETVNLPAGGSVTFTASGNISASATGTLVNTATVSGSITDPVPGNNSATDTDTLTPTADLSITKTDGVATATPGGSVTYTITASNAGPSNDPSATVADTFPASLTATWTCVGAGGGTCTAAGAGNLNDTVNLPAGGSVTYTVSVTISPSATGTLSNTATVSSGVTDPVPANNSATDTDTLTPQADVSITKTDGQTTDAPGTSITYTIVASNAGPSNASSVTVADTFPASLLTVTWTCSGAGGGTCTAAGSGNLNDTANLPAGASVTYSVNATINAGATGTLSNTATVGGGVTDPNPGNNSATDTTTLVAQADLVITKADSAEPVPPGSPLTYTLSITSTGPSTALNVLVTDTLPTEVTWTGDTCAAGPPTGQTLVWNVGTLGSGSSLSCEVYVTVNSAGSGVITNTAVIGSDVLDPALTNNTASEPTITNVPPTLSNVSITSPLNENGTATLTGNISDPDAGDTFTLVVSWGDGSAPQTFNYAAGTTAFSETHQYLDDNPTDTASDNNTVGLTLSDSAGNSDPDSASVTVNNLAPTLSNVAVTNPINENGTATLTGNLADTGTLDTFTLVVDWGDGSAPETFNYAAGTTSFSETHQYLDDNPTGTASDNYTIGLTLTDDDTGSDTDSTSITVNNVSPSLSNLAATATNENGSTTLTGSITDSGPGDTFTLVVDWGDGSAPETFNYAAGTTSFSETHPYLDDNPTGTASDNYTIGLTLTDDDTGSDTDSTSVTVNNVAPVLSNTAITSAVDEGGTATLTGNLADTGTLDSFSLLVDWGDGSAPQTFNYAAGTTAFSETHVYVDDDPTGTTSDPVTVNLTLTDDDTGSDTDTANLTVSNVAPVLSNVAISNPINEGDSATLTGTITDPGTGDTFSLLVDWGDGSAPETFTYAAGTTGFSENHVYADDNPTGTVSDNYAISLTLTDDDTGNDTDSTSITVNNVAPGLTIVYPVPDVNESAPFTVVGEITDPGLADTFTFVADWADGAVVTYTYPAGTTVFTVTHVYADDNPTGTPADLYSPSFSLTDDDTGSLTVTPASPVTVHNVAPVLSNLSSTSVDENGTATLTGMITDASAQDSFTLTVAWGDGSVFTYTYPAGTTVFTETHPYLDDNPTGTPTDLYTVTLTLTDDDTGVGTGTAPLTVTNLPPALSNLAITPVDENNAATLTGVITDTGTLDSFTLFVDWGDGLTSTFTYPAGMGTFTETHTYLDGLLSPLATTYTATLTLTDDDTGQGTGSVSVMIGNTAPTITSLAATSPVNENGTTTLIGTFTDPGTQDTFTVVVDWGDGNVLTATYPAGAFDFMHTHQYLDDDPTATASDTYSITVTLTDDDGGTDTDGVAVTINNLAPVVEAGPAQTVADTAPVAFTGVFTDVGTLDTHTYLWNFGDGDVVTGTLTPTHTFPGVGTYTVTLTITDDDTGVGTDTLTVTVLPATDLSLTKQTVPGPILSGADVVYTLTVSNLGPSDAMDVVITDPLPVGTTFVSASAGCLESAGVVTCALTDLAQGDSIAFTVTATVGLEVNGLLTNTASVTSASADPDLTNNSASATLEAVPTLIVFEDDFENPPIQPEWGCATPVTSTTPVGNRNFLGEFGAETVCLTLTDLPQHAYVEVAFDLYLIRSWDGNLMEMPANLSAYALEEMVGPDVWSFVAEGNIQLATTFANWEFFRQAYPGAYPGGDNPAWTGASEVGTLGYMFYGIPLDSVYHMVFTLPHTGETLDLEFISEQLQDVFDESWGLDNVVVTISMRDQFGTTYQIFLPIIVR